MLQNICARREEMAAYLEACMEEANDDAGFIFKAYSDITRAQDVIAYRVRSSAKLD
jgi:DNA-binding phage protein